MTRIAVLQMTSGIDPEENFRTIERAAVDAGEGGAGILFTPEMSLLLDRDRQRGAATIAHSGYAHFPERLSEVAANTGVDIALGSMPFPAGEKLANRAYYFPACGAEPVTYDKMHMFDVDLATGESWRESNAYAAGDNPVVVEHTPVGRLGLAICYDLRFPALFDALGRQQCDCISIPAAFTVPTGKAHWHVLQRARAIEASAFVVAAAQVGKHADGRTTYGYSLVIDPWGEVLLDMGGEEAGLGFADIDLSRIEEVRAQVPSLANRREIDN
ncbi:carbon-nitrogen hydrolase family protein [Qipengyuania sp. 1NDH17]|uniref:Carbon-nitrogen hydrolase family protein n=1 Tax=Qipengyuania polymorpha TaxID=2867234 RepID=A0ABS7IVG4_9SPHN|nr:carbon-nitrogen hydrolase family protein [Qipengyuania polymorpha]MBX7457415.1 carbon-nitrogen hydrolase family protein [Qipengyuania polymorpha]